MWDHRYLSRIDFRTLPILFFLMVISVLVISATTLDVADSVDESLLTPIAKTQIRWFAIGSIFYLFFLHFPEFR